MAPERRLRRDYVCINSVFGSPEDGATCIIGSVQWRHRVMMWVTTLVDQDSIHFTCSTWQLWVTHLTVVSKCQNKGQTGRSITSLHTPPTSIMPVRKADNYVCHSNYSKFDLRMPLVFTGSGGIRQVGRHATFVNDLAVSPTIYLIMRCHQAKHTFLAINVVPNDGSKVCLGVHSCHVMGSSGY